MLFFVRQVKKLAFNIEEEKQFGELYSIVIMETKFKKNEFGVVNTKK